MNLPGITGDVDRNDPAPPAGGGHDFLDHVLFGRVEPHCVGGKPGSHVKPGIDRFDSEYLAGAPGGYGTETHQTDGPTTENGHAPVVNFPFQDSVNGHSPRLEKRTEVRIDIFGQLPEADRRNLSVLGKSTVDVHANDSHFLADVLQSGLAHVAGLIGNVSFYGYHIPGGEIGHPAAHLHHFSAGLVAENHRWFNPGLSKSVPFVDMDIRPADGGHLYLDEDVPRAYFRNVNVHQPGSGGGFGFYDCFHTTWCLLFNATLNYTLKPLCRQEEELPESL